MFFFRPLVSRLLFLLGLADFLLDFLWRELDCDLETIMQQSSEDTSSTGIVAASLLSLQQEYHVDELQHREPTLELPQPHVDDMQQIEEPTILDKEVPHKEAQLQCMEVPVLREQVPGDQSLPQHEVSPPPQCEASPPPQYEASPPPQCEASPDVPEQPEQPGPGQPSQQEEQEEQEEPPLDDHTAAPATAPSVAAVPDADRSNMHPQPIEDATAAVDGEAQAVVECMIQPQPNEGAATDTVATDTVATDTGELVRAAPSCAKKSKASTSSRCDKRLLSTLAARA